jgi:hypothetical protein
MVGAKASQTPVGQRTEEQIAANKKAAKLVAKILLIVFLIPVITFVVLFFALIVFGDHDSIRSSYTSSRAKDVSSAFSGMDENVRELANKEHYFYSAQVSDMVFYDENSSGSYKRAKLTRSDYVSGFTISATDSTKEDLNKKKFVTDAAMNIDKEISRKLSPKLMNSYSDSDTNDEFTMRLYAKKNIAKKTYDFCYLREIKFGGNSLLNIYRVSASCVEIDEATAESNDIKI